MKPEIQVLTLAPVLTLAILLLATASAWRARREWVERIGLATGIFSLTAALSRLPPAVFAATFLPASVIVTLVVFAASEWRFAPDCGQTGFTWAIQAAARPTLLAALGAAAGLAALRLLPTDHARPWLCALAVFIGLLTAESLAQATRFPFKSFA